MTKIKNTGAANMKLLAELSRDKHLAGAEHKIPPTKVQTQRCREMFAQLGYNDMPRGIYRKFQQRITEASKLSPKEAQNAFSRILSDAARASGDYREGFRYYYGPNGDRSNNKAKITPIKASPKKEVIIAHANPFEFAWKTTTT